MQDRQQMSIDEASRLIVDTSRAVEDLSYTVVEEQMHSLEERIAIAFQDDPELATEFRRSIANDLFSTAIRKNWPLITFRRLLAARDELGYRHVLDKSLKYIMFAVICIDSGQKDWAIEALEAIKQELLVADLKDHSIKRELQHVDELLIKVNTTR